MTGAAGDKNRTKGGNELETSILKAPLKASATLPFSFASACAGFPWMERPMFFRCRPASWNSVLNASILETARSLDCTILSAAAPESLAAEEQ